MGKFLQRFHLSKPEHCPLSSAQGKVTIFNPIVEPPPHFATFEIAQVLRRRRVGAQPVDDDLLGRSVAFQRLLEEPKSGGFVPFSGDVVFEHLASVIDRAPQVVRLAIDLHVHLIKVPPSMAEPAHPANPLATNVGGEQWAKSVPP